MDFENVPIEKVKDYWNARPCNIRHSPELIGTRAYFDQVEARKYFVEPHIPEFASFEYYRGKKVLEIGCGLGTETVNFARAGALVTVVELSQKSLDLTRARLQVFGLLPNVTLICGNAEELLELVTETEFDLVWSFGVVHHSPHPERIIEGCWKLLRPGGEIKLMVYSRVSYKLFSLMHFGDKWEFSGKHIDAVLSEHSEAQTGCPVTYSYTLDQVAQLLIRFRVDRLFKTHIFTWDVDAYRKYQYVKAPEWVNVSEPELHALEKELGWHTCVQATKINY